MARRVSVGVIAALDHAENAGAYAVAGTRIDGTAGHDVTRSTPRRGRASPRKSRYPDRMNNMRAITTRAIIAASVAVCAIVAVPALTFAAPNCNLKRDLKRDLVGTDLSGCDLSYANLRGADLRGATLNGADLRGANLYGADLTGAYLRGAYLRGANLRGATLYLAVLTDADLTGATLTLANLSSADLFGANFTDADLTGAFRRPGISRADMEGVLGLDSITGLVD